MASQAAAKNFQRALSKWPADVLRPHANFEEIMQKRLQAGAVKPPTDSDANALLSLLENRYTNQYPLAQTTLKPASNPNYYDSLVKELHEAPERGWLSRTMNKWRGFLRFQ